MIAKTIAVASLLFLPMVAYGQYAQYAQYAKAIRFADSAAAFARSKYQSETIRLMQAGTAVSDDDLITSIAECRQIRDSVKLLIDRFDAQPVPRDFTRIHSQLVDRLRSASASADTASAAALGMTCADAAPGIPCNKIQRKATLFLAYGHAMAGIDAAVKDYLTSRETLADLLRQHKVQLQPARVPPER